MGKITDMNITGLDKSKMAANLGDSNEHIVAAILIRLGFDVAISAVHGTPYDMLIIGYEKPSGKKIMPGTQLKTAAGSVHSIGGSRGGVDRKYKSGIKTYKYTTEHSGELHNEAGYLRSIHRADETELSCGALPCGEAGGFSPHEHSLGF